jgi:AcrR family transcriptional regulator
MGSRDELRQRIVEAAATLLEKEGREALTTRSVCAAAGIQAPTLYRLFTDMNGLLDEVADAGLSRYLAQKRELEPTGDPVADLRRGWDTHIEFGVENPAYYLLMYGRPQAGVRSRASERGLEGLYTLVERISVAGLLTVNVETAVDMVHSAGVGLTLNLIQMPAERRDLTLVGRLGDAVIGGITGAGHGDRPSVVQRATGLLAVLDEAPGLYSPGERALLDELLRRAADYQEPHQES